MKKLFTLIVMLSLLLSGQVFCNMADATSREAVMCEFYVSLTGNDANSGGKDAPFLTIQRAKEEVRKHNADMTGDIYVYIEEGVYELEDAIEFTYSDSGTNGHYIHYTAKEGEKVVISGGRQIKGKWDYEGDGIYSTAYVRNEKLRSLYVNGKRCYMTSKKSTGLGGYGSYSVTANEADWAWISGSVYKGLKLNKGAVPLDTRNPEDIELMTQTTWNTAIVCVNKLTDIGNSTIVAEFQMPYGAIAQKPGWGNGFQFKQETTIYNVFEWLDEPGEFYFDKSGGRLYYYPREDEDIETAVVTVPEIDSLISIQGESTQNRVKNITFSNITFSDTHWQMYKTENSYGRATVQGAAGMVSFAAENWHTYIYRAYDVGAGAITVNNAENICFYNNTVQNTGNDGLSFINDAVNCIADGNVFYDSAGSAVLIGHPQHTYIGDKGKGYGSFSSREKYEVNEEGVCKGITLTNNLIYEPSRLFWGDAGIMVFHAENFVMRYNHIEETAYNGLSLGWNWWNMNGDSDAIVPGVPTTTNKNNTIEKNTFVRCMQKLGDAGAIYTLGNQKGTVIRENHITNTGNPQLNQHIVRGIHPDEGTQNIYAEKNLIEHMAKPDMAVIDTIAWGRKGNNTWLDTYTTSDRFMSNLDRELEPGLICTKTVRPEAVWNDEVYRIMSEAGIRSGYIKRMPEAIYSVQDRLLRTGFMKRGGQVLALGIDKDDVDGEIWLAKEGTVIFSESEEMTRAEEGRIKVPAKDGEYRLFVVKDAVVSEPSMGRIIVYNDSLVKNLAEEEYQVSREKPLQLEFEEKYVQRAMLNGKEIAFGHKISEGGEYLLELESLAGDVEAVSFTANVSEVDKVFERSITTTGGNVLINPTDKQAWFVPADSSITDAVQLEEGTDMTKNTSDIIIPAPEKNGEYKLILTDGVTVSKYSDATLTVYEGGLTVTQSLLLRLNAEDIDAVENTPVGSWTDSVGGHTLVQKNEGSMPILKLDENGMKYLSFDGVDDGLVSGAGEEINLNGKSNLTIIAFSCYDDDDPKSTSNGDTKATVYFGETGSWGSVFLSPYKSFVMARFGSGQSNNMLKHVRGEGKTGFTVTSAVKDGVNEYLYDNGVMVVESHSKKEKIANTSKVMMVGKTAASTTTYLKGGVAEILIYDRSLSEDEIKAVQAYMNMKTLLPAVDKYINCGEEILSGNYDYIDMEAFRDAHLEMLALRGRIINGEDITYEEIELTAELYNEACHIEAEYVNYFGDKIKDSEIMRVSPFEETYTHMAEDTVITDDGIYVLDEKKSQLVCNIKEKGKVTAVYKKTHTLGKNYITNGSFENENGEFSVEGWLSAKTGENLGDPYSTNDVYAVGEDAVITNGNSTAVSTRIPDGKWALGTLWHEGVNGLRSIKRYVKVDAGKTYLLSYKVRHNKGSDGSYLRTSLVADTNAGENETTEGIGAVGTEWITVTRVFEATKERDHVLFLFRWLGSEKNNGTGGPYWMFDDFYIKEMTPCYPFEYSVSEENNQIKYEVTVTEYDKDSVMAVLAQYDDNGILTDVIKNKVSLTENRSFTIGAGKKGKTHKLILLKTISGLEPLTGIKK